MKLTKTKVIVGLLSLAAVIGIAFAVISTGMFSTASSETDAAATSLSESSTPKAEDKSEDKSWDTWKDNWESHSSNYENVSLAPGKDETSLNYGWYCRTKETPKVRIAVKEDMSGAEEFTGTQEAITLEGLTEYFSNKVTVTGLKENTEYYYQVYQNGRWQEKEEYTTEYFSKFSFLYVGDPQIGACRRQTNGKNESVSETGGNFAARNDAYSWNLTLDNAIMNHPDVSFLISAGDQVNIPTNEEEYAGFLGAEKLASLPVATTIGSHDWRTPQYSYHFNNPNAFDPSDTKYTEGMTQAGTDYYYTYGDVLFIIIDSDNYNCTTHKNVIAKAVKENPQAKWRVVTLHRDVYGTGYLHSNSDGMLLRTQLTPMMDEFDIDVVLQGHDHTYSRSYPLTSDGKLHIPYNSSPSSGAAMTEYIKQNKCYIITDKTNNGSITNPKGTVYIDANSSTGSKFYNLSQVQQDYIAERSQTQTPSYSIIDVTATTFTITVYDALTGEEMDGSSAYTIKKTNPQQIETAKSTYRVKRGSKSFNLKAKASRGGKLSYKSSNTKVAKVNKYGRVTIKGTGTCKITVKAAKTENTAAATGTVKIKVTK